MQARIDPIPLLQAQRSLLSEKIVRLFDFSRQYIDLYADSITQDEQTRIEDGNEQAVVPTTVQQELLAQPIQNATTSETVLGSLSLGHLGISNLFSSIWSFAQDKAETGNLGTTHLDSPSKTTQWKSGCSSPLEISKLLQAMGEMDRIGEASFTIVRTPPWQPCG
jgi:hypothetical protein